MIIKAMIIAIILVLIVWYPFDVRIYYFTTAVGRDGYQKVETTPLHMYFSDFVVSPIWRIVQTGYNLGAMKQTLWLIGYIILAIVGFIILSTWGVVVESFQDVWDMLTEIKNKGRQRVMKQISRWPPKRGFPW